MEQAIKPMHRVSEVGPDGKTGVCSICGPVKVRFKVGRRYYECGTLTKTYRKNQPRRTPAESRRQRLKAKYGLTVEQYNQMYQAVGGACEICSDELPLLHIDHDHDSGMVRGLLCRPCNAGLGHFKDDPTILTRALTYLSDRKSEIEVGP